MALVPIAKQGNFLHIYDFKVDPEHVDDFIRLFNQFDYSDANPMHKSPAQREVQACAPWLEQEIATVDPGAIVALGATAARAVLGHAVPVLANRGQWLAREDGRRVLITLHPSALLRDRGPDRDAAIAAWIEDLRRAAG